MDKYYIEKINENNAWIFDERFAGNLICTDDLDSLLSCLLLMQYRPNMQIGYFYDFREGLYKKEGIDESLPVVGVDLSHPGDMRCVSNHVTSLDGTDFNKNDINLSNIDGITVKNYHQKYNLNTFLLSCALLGHKLTTKEECVIGLLFDSAFLPFYQNPAYQDAEVQKRYLVDVLEMPEVHEVQKTMDKTKFLQAQYVLNTKSKLWIDEYGIRPVQNVDLKTICKYLRIDFDPSVLEGLFMQTEIHKSFSGYTHEKFDKLNMFSFAITSKKVVKYSKKM